MPALTSRSKTPGLKSFFPGLVPVLESFYFFIFSLSFIILFFFIFRSLKIKFWTKRISSHI